MKAQPKFGHAASLFSTGQASALIDGDHWFDLRKPQVKLLLTMMFVVMLTITLVAVSPTMQQHVSTINKQNVLKPSHNNDPNISVVLAENYQGNLVGTLIRTDDVSIDSFAENTVPQKVTLSASERERLLQILSN